MRFWVLNNEISPETTLNQNPVIQIGVSGAYEQFLRRFSFRQCGEV